MIAVLLRTRSTAWQGVCLQLFTIFCGCGHGTLCSSESRESILGITRFSWFYTWNHEIPSSNNVNEWIHEIPCWSSSREIWSIVSKRVLIRQTRTKTVITWCFHEICEEWRCLRGMESREIMCMLECVRHLLAVLRPLCSFHFTKLRKWPFIYWTRESFSYFAADLIGQCFLLVWKKLPNFNNMFCLFL